jgi:hypothetical protein
MMARGSHTGFAGYATLFDASDHYDKIGCAALNGQKAETLQTLGSEAEGISQDPTVCPDPCRAGATEGHRWILMHAPMICSDKKSSGLPGSLAPCDMEAYRTITAERCVQRPEMIGEPPQVP